MKQAEIKNLSTEELNAKLAETIALYNKLSIAHKVSPMQNPIQLKDLRRSIARIKTALTNNK